MCVMISNFQVLSFKMFDIPLEQFDILTCLKFVSFVAFFSNLLVNSGLY